MDNNLRRFLIKAFRDWHDNLGEIEVRHDEGNEFMDNPAAKEYLVREIRETRSKLERIGENARGEA